jgi:hypothetical protein
MLVLPFRSLTLYREWERPYQSLSVLGCNCRDCARQYVGSSRSRRVRCESAALRVKRMAAPISVAPIPKVLSPDTNMFITDGPFLETKEHIGGFWILEAADMDEALA